MIFLQTPLPSAFLTGYSIKDMQIVPSHPAAPAAPQHPTQLHPLGSTQAPSGSSKSGFQVWPPLAVVAADGSVMLRWVEELRADRWGSPPSPSPGGAGEATLIGAATGEEQTETSRAPVTAGRTEVLYCGLGVNVGQQGALEACLVIIHSQPAGC